MGDSAIEWTDKTWPITVGCEHKSEGCRNCYAERTVHRVNVCQAALGNVAPYADLIKLVKRGDRMVPRWTGKARFFADRLSQPLRWRKPCRIFVSSQSDLFHEDITNEQIAAVFGVMAAAPRHTFQILTKRPARMVEWFRWLDGQVCETGEHAEWCVNSINEQNPDAFGGIADGQPWPLPNVWLGVSVENQAAADERIPLLLQVPAAVRFLSCEPLLGPVTLPMGSLPYRDDDGPGWPFPNPGPHLTWLIAGAESGPGARPCSVEWLRSLRDQCAAAGVAFFLKQADGGAVHVRKERPDAGRGAFELVRTEPITAGPGSHRKGAVIGAPYLDGVQHLAFPTREDPTP